MHTQLEARAHGRALAGAVLAGSALGAILGAAYLGGGAARAATDHAKTSRLAVVAADGFSEDALMQDASLSSAPGALAIMRRIEPAAAQEQTRRYEVLQARLAQVTPGGKVIAENLQKANFTSAAPGAAPFRMGGAFEATRDFDCLAQAVYYEARGEGQAGQAAVAQVVLNRVRHRAYPKTVCGVVFQRAGGGCQFSFACDGSMRRGKEQAAWRRAKAVAAQALSGSVMTAVGSATSFHTTGVSPGWGGLVRVAQIGSHIFYRSGGASGFIQGAKPYIGSAREMVTQVDKPAYAYTVLGPSSRESGLMLASNVTTVAPKEPVAVPAAKDAPKAESAAATPTVEEPVKSAS